MISLRYILPQNREAMKVIDDSGNIYTSLWKACKVCGLTSSGRLHKRLKKHGHCKVSGITFTAIPDGSTTPEAKIIVQKDPMMERIRMRYSDSEIEAIARGEGIERRRVDFPDIKLNGTHHKFLVISDTHIGSVYSPIEWHDIVSDYANNNGVEAILHCGDLVEGMKIGRIGTQIYELSEIGYEAQKAKAIEILGKYKVPIYIISGNHDFYYQEYAGANVIKSISDSLENVTYIGHDSADIEVDGAIIRLFHGGDGSNSYAVSYRLQKLCEAITGGEKPNILLAGHVHKFCYIFERNIHAISVPCMQAQTDWMRGKKLAAHTGFLELDFDVSAGSISNLSVRLFPFYA